MKAGYKVSWSLNVKPNTNKNTKETSNNPIQPTNTALILLTKAKILSIN